MVFTIALLIWYLKWCLFPIWGLSSVRNVRTFKFFWVWVDTIALFCLNILNIMSCCRFILIYEFDTLDRKIVFSYSVNVYFLFLLLYFNFEFINIVWRGVDYYSKGLSGQMWVQQIHFISNYCYFLYILFSMESVRLKFA